MQKILTPAFLVCSTTLAAQREDITGSMPFFEQALTRYESWLKAEGLGSVLYTDEVRFQASDSNALEMVLILHGTQPDSAIALWYAAKAAYDTDSDSLEHYLYRTYIHTMEVPGEQANLQIYVRNEYGEKVPCFRVWVWQKNGRLIISTKRGTCKDKKLYVSIPPLKTVTTVKGKKKTVTHTRPAAEVFVKVREHLTQTLINDPKYRTKELNDRQPHIVAGMIETGTTLHLTVADLGKVVLTDQNRGIWESWFGVNTIAMERLTFDFTYRTRSKEEGGGYDLSCNINGKFGSGVFKPRASAYMDMQPDFDDYLEAYKNRLQDAFKALLEKP
jgi:hypothetical protein